MCSPGIQSFDRSFIDLGEISFSGNGLPTCIRKYLGNFFMLTYWVGQPSEKVLKCADVVPLMVSKAFNTVKVCSTYYVQSKVKHKPTQMSRISLISLKIISLKNSRLHSMNDNFYY